LQQGRLVRLTDAAIKPRGAYFVVVPTRQHNNEAAGLFVNWLQIAAQEPEAHL
jgi:hypothetical protein